MGEKLEFIGASFVIGVGATVVLDSWAALLKLLFGVPSPNWALVGRWFGHLPRGRFIHDNIANASPIRGELIIGWLAHYVIGIVYSTLLLIMCGVDWASGPTLLPALTLSLLALVAPFFILQPGMGAGVAASKTPNPNAARLRSVLAHTIFGVGLYVSALFWAAAINQ
jgi:Protein of unknown function (DUF2938)